MVEKVTLLRRFLVSRLITFVGTARRCGEDEWQGDNARYANSKMIATCGQSVYQRPYPESRRSSSRAKWDNVNGEGSPLFA